MTTPTNPNEQQAKPSAKSQASGKSTAADSKGQSFGEYLQGVKSEWTKVSWPGWPQIWAQTLVVVFMTTVVTVGLLGIDQVIKFSVGLITEQPPQASSTGPMAP